MTVVSNLGVGPGGLNFSCPLQKYMSDFGFQNKWEVISESEDSESIL